jgi:hypothetical protein
MNNLVKKYLRIIAKILFTNVLTKNIIQCIRRTMKLQKYIKKQKTTVNKFSRENNLKQPTVWRIINNKCCPRAETARVISIATGGLVTINELLFPDNK